MRLATWNVRGNTGIRIQRQEEILRVIRELAADVVLLQEVHETALAQLGQTDLKHVVRGELRANYGNVIASRFPLSELEPGWFAGTRTSSVTGVKAHTPDGEFTTICAHIPNGSGNGWVKIETFEALAAAVNRLSGPVALGGDFNEPRTVIEDGTVIPFSMKKDSSGEWHHRGAFKANCGDRFPRARWVRGVRAVLGLEPSINLLHALRQTRGPAAFHATHQVRGRDRFFDHLLVSPDFNVLSAGFDDDCRLRGVSDHSAGWVDVRLTSAEES